jgi:hypothetical protein
MASLPSNPVAGNNYYAGCKEIAQETPVTLNRLEPVSRISIDGVNVLRMCDWCLVD